MDKRRHTLSSLFDQLGMPSTEQAIEKFIDIHRPLPSTRVLHMAPFWNAAQASFLAEEIERDADWAEVIDQLNVMLH